ncbi:hypothetical protein MYP_3303 [Sporocytophaga myxococcoides]|uniref:Uncharacterized protein n=1 Tax=Sporocytophaga myxococcoides TaxID=153721 RepID=A0A098LHZ4_9BACT|nr:hypothetical protein [Sporocytophaga myxococcoides]GAL86074.1 hypothetical protein MYP_3303 [Sporocytophaga myxococcoides]
MSQLNELIEKLEKLENEFLQSSLRIINAGDKKIYSMDLLSTAVNNRALQITKGFVSLARENNYICAVPLIRLQLDNVLRFFATTLVSNYDDLFIHYLEGNPINRYRDSKGNLLTDNYLARSLEKIFPGTLKLYSTTSGYIHLSEKHFFANIKEEDRKIQMAVGASVHNFSESDKTDFVKTMIEVSNLVIIILEQWKHRKEFISKN